MLLERLLPICLLAFASLVGCASTRAGPGDVPFSDLQNERQALQLIARIRESPGDTGARYRLVQVYLGELMFDRATGELREILRLAPRELKAYELLALLQAKGPENDIAGSIETLRAALRIMPGESSLHSNLALRYLDRGDIDAAEKEARVAADPAADASDRATAYLILSGICALKGRSEEAVQYAAKAEEIEPGSANTGPSPSHLPMFAGEPGLFDEFFASHPDSLKRARRLDKLLRKRREPEPH